MHTEHEIDLSLMISESALYPNSVSLCFLLQRSKLRSSVGPILHWSKDQTWAQIKPLLTKTPMPTACPTHATCIPFPIIFCTAGPVCPVKSADGGKPILCVTRILNESMFPNLFSQTKWVEKERHWMNTVSSKITKDRVVTHNQFQHTKHQCCKFW